LLNIFIEKVVAGLNEHDDLGTPPAWWGLGT